MSRDCPGRGSSAGIAQRRENTRRVRRARGLVVARRCCVHAERGRRWLCAHGGNTRRSGSRQKKSRSFRRSYGTRETTRDLTASRGSLVRPIRRSFLPEEARGLVIARLFRAARARARAARRGRHCITAVMSRAFSDAATVEVGSGPSIDCGAGHTETTCAFECNWCLEKQICADSWQACQLPATPARWPWLTILLFCIACGCMYLFAQRRLRHPVVASDASSGVVHESRAYESYELDELDALPAATAPSPSQLQPEGQRLLGV